MTSTALPPDPLRYLPLAGWMTAFLLVFDFASIQAKFTITPRPVVYMLIALEIWLYYWLIQCGWGLLLRNPHLRAIVAEMESESRTDIKRWLSHWPTAGLWAVRTWLGSCVSHGRGRLFACNGTRLARETLHLRFVLDMRVVRLVNIFLRFHDQRYSADIAFEQARAAADACDGGIAAHDLDLFAPFLELYVPAWEAMEACPTGELCTLHAVLRAMLSKLSTLEDQFANLRLTNDFTSITVTRFLLAAKDAVERRWRILDLPARGWSFGRGGVTVALVLVSLVIRALCWTVRPQLFLPPFAELTIYLLLKEVERAPYAKKTSSCPSQVRFFDAVVDIINKQPFPTLDLGLILVPYLQARVAEEAALKLEPELHRAILDTLLVRNELKQRSCGLRDDKREAGSLRRSD